jgi:hypothetical protein
MPVNHNSILTKVSFKHAYVFRLKKYLPDLKNKKLIDIGAGYGHFANAARLFEANVHVLEPRVECKSVLGKMCFNKFFHGSMENEKLPKEYYDICSAITVLDEIVDKKAFLASVSYCLKLGGLFFVEVRNFNYMKLFHHNLETDITLEEYICLFRDHGFHIKHIGGEARPLTFGSLVVLLKTIFANIYCPIVRYDHRQMLVFVLVKVGS